MLELIGSYNKIRGGEGLGVPGTRNSNVIGTLFISLLHSPLFLCLILM